MSKYDEVLKPFTAAMDRELHANMRKGDRPAWLQVSAATLMLELLYHHSKLQVALDAGDGDRILEYSADIANISMMIADVCGALPLIQLPPAPVPRTNGEIVEETMELADKFYSAHGYISRPGFRYDLSSHPQERFMWQLACEAQEFLRDTDANDALGELEGDE